MDGGKCFHSSFFASLFFSVDHSVHLPRIFNRSITTQFCIRESRCVCACLVLANAWCIDTDKFILNFNLDSLISIYAYCSYINMIMSIFLLRLQQLSQLITARKKKNNQLYSQLINFVKQSTLLSAADRCFHVACVVFLYLSSCSLPCKINHISNFSVPSIENRSVTDREKRANNISHNHHSYVSF